MLNSQNSFCLTEFRFIILYLQTVRRGKAPEQKDN